MHTNANSYFRKSLLRGDAVTKGDNSIGSVSGVKVSYCVRPVSRSHLDPSCLHTALCLLVVGYLRVKLLLGSDQQWSFVCVQFELNIHLCQGLSRRNEMACHTCLMLLVTFTPLENNWVGRNH